MFNRLALFILIICSLAAQKTWAVACADVWPARYTANSSVAPDLPAFTGTSQMTLSRTLGAGDYHYSATNQFFGDLTVNGGASTRIYINGDLTISGSSDLNQSGNPEDLIIIVNGNFTTGSTFFDTIYINAIVYVTGQVSLSSSTNLTGVVTAAGNVSGSSRINYDSTAVSNADFGSLCGTDPADSLVAFYQLDGPTWNGTANEVLDTSGNGLNGTTINGVVSNTAQVCNGAHLTGTEFIRVADNNALDLTSQLTVTAWVYATNYPGELHTIVSKDENFEFHIDNDGSVYWWWVSSGGTRSFDTGTTRLSLNTWYHIAIVYSSTRQSIYINGVEIAFRTYSGETLTTNTDPLEIGSDQVYGDRFWEGIVDEVKIYSSALTATNIQDIMNETRVCPSTLDHFAVSAAATASVCAATEVTITAQQTDNSTYTGYTGTIDISTSSVHGNWSVSSGSGTLNPNPDNNDDGVVQYTFNAADNGVVRLWLDNTHADQLTVSVVENGGSASGTSGTISFSENAFVIAITDTLSTDFVAGRDHDLQIQAVRQDPSTGYCGLFEQYNGTIGLKAWVTRTVLDPSPAGTAPLIVTASGNVALGSSEPGLGNNVLLVFSAGVADTQLITSDVGQYFLNVKDFNSGLVKDISGNPLTIEGSSASAFTVRPFGFDLSASGNPSASTATGSVFVKAGADFDVSVRAVVHETGDDSNDDGYPDASADLSGNTATPSFGNESETATLNGVLVLPSGGYDPGLSGTLLASSFSAGVATNTVHFDEVGIIQINANLTSGSYLGSGKTVDGQIPFVGRIYPDYFSITHNNPELADGTGTCGFTYRDQPFGFSTEPELTLEAYGVTDVRTLNYAANFWKLSSSQHTLALNSSTVPSGSTCDTSTCLTENSATVSPQWINNNDYDGTALWSTNTHSLTLEKINGTPGSADIPFNPLIDLSLSASALTDSDGACYKASGSCSAYQISGINTIGLSSNYLNCDGSDGVGEPECTQSRWGRGTVDSAQGSVMTNLPMTLQLQHWNASAAWQKNTDDDIACGGTSLLTSDIGIDPDVDASDNLNTADTSASSVNAYPGYYVLLLSAPGFDASGNPKQGRADITWDLSALPWLRYDWVTESTPPVVLEDPVGSAVFTSLPDNRPILFRRETYR